MAIVRSPETIQLFYFDLNTGRLAVLRFANINGLLRLVLTVCQSARTLAVDHSK